MAQVYSHAHCIVGSLFSVKMREKYLEFVDKLEEHGLLCTRVLGEGDDPSSPIGRSWKSTFLTKDKDIAKQSWNGWNLEDGVKSIMGPISAVKYNSTRQRKIWFNSMVAVYIGWKDARNDHVKAVTFGNGTSLPMDIIHNCLKILEEESVVIPWQRDDVLLLDDLAVLHSRKSFSPPCRMMASLGK
ncbi:putative TauD/TfdA-like domain-containing protein [Rosa chinensis]|uniref:Putative TauD/TfdA-like domain-containing protein n=1 Tax=Rosa chinensis TaxID=74649 RepID=A0A2P6RXD9_ROSCH|nr:putative TauD/TfdA-like domain-containing protein [Rosa chinensis]